jgi:NAD+ diphosphatase
VATVIDGSFTVVIACKHNFILGDMMNLHFTTQRQAHLRHNEAQLEQWRLHAETLLMVGNQVVMQQDQIVWQPIKSLTEVQRSSCVFLGCFPQPLFAVHNEQFDLDETHQLRDLRSFALNANDADIHHVFYASALFTWQKQHRYCGVCGGRNQFEAGGHQARCTQCQHTQFPRTDPAVIVAVTHGDQILLGRQASWPAKRFSVLAGFVEPGESLEQACAREIEEESGVRIKNVSYFASQPWPFPLSLMLAFFAEAQTTTISLNDNELEQALWLNPDQLELAVLAGDLLLPPSASVARRLLKHWYKAVHHRDWDFLLSRTK